MHFDIRWLADAIWIGVSVLALVLAFQYIFLPTAIDCFRDRLFKIRRELFLLMATGRVSAKDPSYVSMQNGLNGFIRFAERITFLRGVVIPVVATMVFPRRRGGVARTHAQADAAIENITDQELKANLERLDWEMAKAVFTHVLVSSPIGWFVTMVGLPILVVAAVVAGSVTTVKAKLVHDVSDRVECDVTLMQAA